MKTITTIAEMRAAAHAEHGAGRRIGFVPTMGALHEGHLSLMRQAAHLSDCVVASIFVNPLQFGANEDLDAYPRQLEADAELCRKTGVDILFAPPVPELLLPDRTVGLDETTLSQGLCGAFRPGHFQGVLTIVTILFNVVTPDVAVLGQKDAQQGQLIRQLVRDLQLPISIELGQIVRESDGMALSSRNRYLSPGERQRATCLVASLRLAESLVAGGESDAGVVTARMRERCLAGDIPVSIDYVAAVDRHTLAPVDRIGPGTLVALAVRIGAARLIDNTVIGDPIHSVNAAAMG